MYRKILISGMTAAAIVGAGGVALATTGSDSTGGSGSSSSQHSATGQHGKKGKNGKKMKGRRLLRRVDHAQIVTHTKKGDVTHELIRGTVTDVSATSITVTSADHTTDSFVVSKDTKVRKRTDGKPASSTISAVAKGDRVFVAGIGASTPVARHVLDRGTK